MQQRTIEFEQHLKTLTALNNDLKDRSGKMLEELKNVVGNNSNKCSVCYTREASFAFLPCGHASFCENCSQRGLHRRRCFMCRAHVESVVKIFL